MTDDIVTLLRKYQPYNKLHREAADEIERLRAQVLMLADQQHFDNCTLFGCSYCARVMEARRGRHCDPKSDAKGKG